MPAADPFVTFKSSQVDDYHGELVADPYRWLEDSVPDEVRRWVEHQNELTEGFLARVPSRERIRERLTAIWDYPKYGVPFERGGRWFQERNSGLQDQSVYYVMGSPDGDASQVLLDPNVEDGAVSVPVVEVSYDGSLVAYATSEAGSDWATWHVREVGSGRDLPDVVEWCKNPRAAWKKDGSGFYYSATGKPGPGGERTGLVGNERIFFHAVGTSQDDDQLVWEAPDEPEWLPYVTVSDDGRFAIISVTVGTSPEVRISVLDLERPEAGLQPLVGDFSCLAWVVGNIGTTFFVLTDDNAERHRVVAIGLGSLTAGNGGKLCRNVTPCCWAPASAVAGSYATTFKTRAPA